MLCVFSDEVFGVSSSAVSEYNPARYQVNVNGLNGQVIERYKL